MWGHQKMALEQHATVRLVPFSTSSKCVILTLLSCQTQFVLREGQMRILLMPERTIHLTLCFLCMWGVSILHANIEQRATKLLPHRTYWVMRKRWKWQECLQLCWELQYSLKDTRGRINSYGAETGLHPLNLWPVNFKSELRGWCALEKSCEEFKEQIWECQMVNRGAGQTCHVHTLRS